LLRFLLGRLLSLVAILLCASFVIFGSLHLAPGSPETLLARGHSVTPQTLVALREEFNLNDPLVTQYVKWLTGVVQGDFGRSLQFRQPVGPLVASRLPTTLSLVAYAGALIIVGGVLLGALGALRGGAVDKGVIVFTAIGVAMPTFVAAIILISIFSVELGWMPAFGDGEGFAGRVQHLTLPAIALALMSTALMARSTRSAMIDELAREHVDTARSRGVPELTVIRRHVFRNALGPIATQSALLIAALLVVTTVVETAFGLSGLGSLLVQSVNTMDFPVVQACVLLVVFAYVVANTAVDLAYPYIDPRVSWGEKRS